MTVARSFTDPETSFTLLRDQTPVSVDGIPEGAPIGLVMCDECHEVAWDCDEIDHADGCNQADVKSEFWRATHEAGD